MSVSLAPNSLFARDFVILRPLSEGGMGAIYLVEQRSTGNYRALKLMHPQFVQDPSLRQRFEQEARVGSKIASDHIVQVVAAGIDQETGYPFLAMELLRGEDLGAAMLRRGALPLAEVREIVAQLGHALAAAHAAGIVHRDLKPENIFLSISNREGASVLVKVLDFGVAKVIAEAKTKLTAPLGTPLWMAPEQTERSSNIGPPTDVWALGLIVFRALTGRYYWVAGNHEDTNTAVLLREILMEPIVPASRRAAELGVAALLPPGFDDWFGRCVNRDSAARFADGGDARIAFARLAEAPFPTPVGVASQVAAPQTLVSPLGERLSRVEQVAPTEWAAPPLRPSRQGPLTWASAGQGEDAPSTVNAAPAMTALPAPGLTQSPFVPAYGASYADPRGTLPGIPPHPAPGVAPTVRPRGYWACLPFVIAGLVVLALGIILIGVLVFSQLSVSQAKRRCETNSATVTAGNAAGVLEDCKQVCSRSAGMACVIEGELLQRFRPKEGGGSALAAFEKACEGKEMRGCRRTGALLERQHPARAAELYEQGCAGGEPGSCTLLGALFEQGNAKPRDRSRAASLYDQGCRGGDPLGCIYWAFVLGAGRGVKQDVSRATEIARGAVVGLTQNCDRGGIRECVALASVLTQGLGTPKDESRAVQLNQLACDAGDLGGCTNLGVQTVQGVGIFKDVKRGLALLQKACEGGEPTACTDLGILQAHAAYVIRQEVGGTMAFKLACDGVVQVGCAGWGPTRPVSQDVPIDLLGAVTLSTKACDAGELIACVNLGAFYQYAIGTTKNRQRAADLFKSACEGGDAGACGELGTLYEAGRVLPQDGRRALELLRMACEWGEQDSCVVMASFMAQGIGVPKDPGGSAAIFKKYCIENNLAMACVSWANSLSSGNGVAKDVSAAREVLQSVCENRRERPYPEGCSALGELYENGGPEIADQGRAFQYYQQACSRGNSSGCNNLARAYANGIGCAKDDTQARALVESGCSRGEPASCDTLGYFRSMGKAGFHASGAEALPIFQRACDDGYWNSCASQGLLHLWGIGGLPVDKNAAAPLLRLACAHRQEVACKALRDNGL